MRDCDLADSSLARCPAETVPDSLRDLLREALEPHISPDRRHQAFAALDATLEEAEEMTGEPASPGIFETLRAIFGDTRLPEDVRRRACAAAIGSNDPQFGKSYQHYADYFGLTRACLHADARDVQKKFGVRARRDKKDSARQQSEVRARRPRTAQPVAEIRRKPTRLFSFLPGLS